MKIGIGIVVAIIVVYVVINIANEFETGGTGAAGGPCFTKCTWFREKRCEDNQDIGWCFLSWGCSDEIGAHPCGQ